MWGEERRLRSQDQILGDQSQGRTCLEIYSKGVIRMFLWIAWAASGPWRDLCVSAPSAPSGWSLRLGLSERHWRKCQITVRGTLSGTEPLWGQSLPSLLHLYPAPPWQNHETSLLCTRKGKKKKKKKTRRDLGNELLGGLISLRGAR